MRLFQWKTAIDLLVSAVLVVAAATTVWVNFGGKLDGADRSVGSGRHESEGTRTAALPPSELVSVAGSPAKGAVTSPFVVIEFSDFACPFCARFAQEVLPELQRQYIAKGKVRFVFKHLPLTKIHPFARRAAEYAECARRHDRFWEVHDGIFGLSATGLGPQSLNALATQAGLSSPMLQACENDLGSVRIPIEEDIALAGRLKIRGTPTFLIGVSAGTDRVRVLRMLSGTVSLTVLAAHIKSITQNE